ncbi:hypothetical protein F5B19DRAFT_17566 [Rostrohypoxylon terebratum]|nr:hypothetical protein F5B19DRAFT_17566 [Rostrohypoxylon terebratum]
MFSLFLCFFFYFLFFPCSPPSFSYLILQTGFDRFRQKDAIIVITPWRAGIFGKGVFICRQPSTTFEDDGMDRTPSPFT